MKKYKINKKLDQAKQAKFVKGKLREEAIDQGTYFRKACRMENKKKKEDKNSCKNFKNDRNTDRFSFHII
jgi:hypothetical protein